MKEQIKELRIKTDGLAQLTKELKPIKLEKATFENNIGKIKTKNGFEYIDEGLIIVLEKSNTKEIEKAVDSLYLGKAWLGKVLGELRNENPYGSGYKTKEDIVPTQDVASPNPDLLTNGFDLYWWEKEANHIEKVDWLRSSLEEIIKEVVKIDVKSTREFSIARTNCHTHLCEARFWLGFEMERIKNEK